MASRNLTLQLDETVIHRAKILAAKRGTSVSSLVAKEIERIVEDDERYEAARRLAEELIVGASSRGGRRWTRGELYGL